MKSIIVSGDKRYGLSKTLKEKFPEAFFASRKTGFDFTKHEDTRCFVEMSLEYDVYISCSSLHSFLQTKLLHDVYKNWKENSHKGHIIALGSSADTPVKGSAWIYPIEKKSLRTYCRNLSQRVLGGGDSISSGVRVTYLSPGYVDTPKANEDHPEVKKIQTEYLANTIQWLLNQPEEYNISELCVDPIQP